MILTFKFLKVYNNDFDFNDTLIFRNHFDLSVLSNLSDLSRITWKSLLSFIIFSRIVVFTRYKPYLFTEELAYFLETSKKQWTQFNELMLRNQRVMAANSSYKTFMMTIKKGGLKWKNLTTALRKHKDKECIVRKNLKINLE